MESLFERDGVMYLYDEDLDTIFVHTQKELD